MALRTSKTAWRDIRSPLTVEDLRDMLVAPSRGVIAFPSRPYDEVYPGIIIGDCWAATDTVILNSLRVTAVLNSAQGMGQPYLVDTDSYFYESRRLPVKFLGLRAIDADWYRLEDWFQVAADFIHDSRRSVALCASSADLDPSDRPAPAGKVLVHCVQGLSRSATLVIAYLMIKLHMSLSQALQTVRARREIFPNDGFLQQLIRLNDQLMGMRRVNVSWL